MTPLLFPHTYLAPELVAAAAHWFPQLTLYQPVAGCLPDDLRSSVSDGFLNVRIPVPDDSDRVAAAARDYRAWARQHHHRHALKTILPRAAAVRPPFFEDSATSQIISELRGAGQEDAPHALRLFNARLFLCLAQDLDQKRHELRRQFDRLEDDSRALADALQPEPGPETADPTQTLKTSPEESSEYMLAERLNAWTQLFLADSLDTVLLLTPSRSIIADFIESSDTAEVLMRLNSEKLPSASATAPVPRQHSLLAELDTVCRQSWPFGNQPVPASAAEEDAADLALYLIPDQPLRPFLANLTGARISARIQPHPVETAAKHVLVGWLNPGKS